MSRLQTQLSLSDRGRRMSLADFENAETLEGQLFELSRGEVVVVDVPHLPHAVQVDTLREQVSGFRRANPGIIKAILSGGECKIPLHVTESERHPDLAIYCTFPDTPHDWSAWIPEVVIEVVSPTSRQRDYEEKPKDYLQFGIREYWIVDRAERVMLVHRRVGGQWKVIPVRPIELYACPVLRGCTIDIAKVFAAADELEG